jgi:hypothetical protein
MSLKDKLKLTKSIKIKLFEKIKLIFNWIVVGSRMRIH